MMWLSTCMVIAQGRQLVTSFTIEFGKILSLSCEQNQPSKNNDLFGRFIAKDFAVYLACLMLYSTIIIFSK